MFLNKKFKMSQKDYLKTGNRITRPILSIYELSNTITSLAKSIYEDKSVESYVDEDNINDFLNPAHIAFELLHQKNMMHILIVILKWLNLVKCMWIQYTLI